ncbi:aryl-sulfate sulfotransferase [Niameybacter massiliensis]|uniref:Aryl-sulfate sulfotransferase n=1 Tax=Holtiella tumoricola TaxID=3018743 RepID=A0AA42DNL5_9FIRM|nr:aryl-sulfate sulfotransferase [Holtiella tumoricola]MDA3731893.1 aryl-sulfate sulfotransferase [Holtiella tumoricola]
MLQETIKYEKIDHLVNRQYEQEQMMLKTFNEGHYTLENPYVKVNPYFVSPLTALVMFRTEESVTATITVKGKEEAGNITHTFKAGTEHKLPILGLYPNYQNTVEIKLSNGESTQIKLQTDELNDMPHQATYIKTTSEYMQDQIMFVTPSGDSLAGGYDYRGDCRWHLVEPFIFDMKRAKNGNILIGSNRLMKVPYYTAGLCEMSLMGKVYTEYCIPGSYHHDQFEMEDGNLLILTQEKDAKTSEDMCVLVDRNTGEIIKSWDYKKVLPQDVAKSGSWSEHDWFHNNAVWYDKRTNSLTLSGRHQDAVINIDYETGDLNWIIGDPEGWPQEMVEKYFFTPVGDGEFDWQYEQHACMMLPDGDVMVFDNGHWRAKNKENYVLNRDNFSRGVRYRINTEDMTIEQVWQFGKERANHFYSSYISNVEYYRDGYYLVHSGGIGYNHGVTCEELPVYMDLSDPENKLNSITVEIMDGEVMFEMHLPSNYYRAEKMRFYHEGENLTFGKGRVLGEIGKTEEFETGIPGVEITGELIPAFHEASVVEEEDRIVFEAKFKRGQLAMLQLERGQEEHRYYISTSAKPFLAMCVGTFQPKDDRTVTINVNKEGLKGEFDLRLIVDDKKYESGLKLKF